MDALIVVAVPAIVKLAQELNKKNWSAVLKISLAVIAGAALGYATGDVAGIADGIISGLAGAGIVTVAGKITPPRE